MRFSDRSLDFERDGQDWPNREASRFVRAAGIDWHVQEVGAGPVLLLLHGTGAATHSWRGLIPLLAPHFRVVAIDLPGHGFTQRPPQALLAARHGAWNLPAARRARRRSGDGRRPFGGRGGDDPHGARLPHPSQGLVSLNGALTPYGGAASKILSPIAKLLFLNPFMPRLFAWRAGDRASVQRLIRNTGSTIDDAGVDQYRLLVSCPDHVSAALGMMANWDLQPLARDMALLDVPLLLVAGTNDKAVRSEDAFTIRATAPHAKVEIMRGLGHLAHEEAPEAVAALMLGFAGEVGAVDDPA